METEFSWLDWKLVRNCGRRRLICSLTKNLKFLRASLHHTHELARIIFLVTYHVLRYFLDIQVRKFLHNNLYYIFKEWNISKSDFAKMTGSLHQTHKKKFRIYAVYATAAPATLSLVLTILDNSLNETYLLYPNISIDRCWFAGKTLFQKIYVLIKLIFFSRKVNWISVSSGADCADPSSKYCIFLDNLL